MTTKWVMILDVIGGVEKTGRTSVEFTVDPYMS